MLAVGFEPTRANTGHLKCLPLDQLGHVSVINFAGNLQFSIGTIPRFHVLQRELNPHPVIKSDSWICCTFPLFLCSIRLIKSNLLWKLLYEHILFALNS